MGFTFPLVAHRLVRRAARGVDAKPLLLRKRDLARGLPLRNAQTLRRNPEPNRIGGFK